MSQIILDFGSANTCQNDVKIVKRMIDELHAIDTGKHEVIIKWQLFEHAGQNIPLDHEVFMWAYDYAKLHGYQTTASVFDKASLAFLLCFDTPFIKLANREDLYWLKGYVPRNKRVLISWGDSESIRAFADDYGLCCVSNYPANMADYEKRFKASDLELGISDHTTNWKLFNKYKPIAYEVHYKLPDSTGLDAGKFARTARDLKAIL